MKPATYDIRIGMYNANTVIKHHTPEVYPVVSTIKNVNGDTTINQLHTMIKQLYCLQYEIYDTFKIIGITKNDA